MDVDVRRVVDGEHAAVAGVAARSLRHLFVHVGDDPVAQLRAAYRAYGGLAHDHDLVFGAFSDGFAFAMARAVEPGHCWCSGVLDTPEPSDAEARGLWAYRRFLRDHHPAEPHWWFGPVGVEPGLQRQGLGAAVMRAALAEIDARGGGQAWLEAEPHIVGFYERLGFVEADSATDPDGVALIFMRR
jgi:ribosomal protein S18 acetylase RimI-like enzyme